MNERCNWKTYINRHSHSLSHARSMLLYFWSTFRCCCCCCCWLFFGYYFHSVYIISHLIEYMATTSSHNNDPVVCSNHFTFIKFYLPSWNNCDVTKPHSRGPKKNIHFESSNHHRMFLYFRLAIMWTAYKYINMYSYPFCWPLSASYFPLLLFSSSICVWAVRYCKRFQSFMYYHFTDSWKHGNSQNVQ